jgi:hypothetical protein
MNYQDLPDIDEEHVKVTAEYDNSSVSSHDTLSAAEKSCQKYMYNIFKKIN